MQDFSYKKTIIDECSNSSIFYFYFRQQKHMIFFPLTLQNMPAFIFDFFVHSESPIPFTTVTALKEFSRPRLNKLVMNTSIVPFLDVVLLYHKMIKAALHILQLH